MLLHKEILLTIYNRLYQSYGAQYWWPADSAFEVMVGAILTQNTAWVNAEKAIVNLNQAGLLRLETMQIIALQELAQYIRPAGYFNVKSHRLKSLCQWLEEQGGIDALKSCSTEQLRLGLLSINGIGPESADVILLYAFERPVFVIDTYTRRLLKKFGMIDGSEDYETLRRGFESTLDPDTKMFNEYHALIVRHEKQKCITTDECKHCRIEAPIQDKTETC